MTQIPDNESLLASALKGDRGSLVSLLEALAPQIRGRIEPKITAHLRPSLDADDVMQVTYMEAYLRLSRFKTGGVAGFVSWLTRLAENNLIDAIRALESAKRPDPRNRVTGGGSPEQSMVALVEMLGATTSTPSRHAAKGEAGKFLEQALAAVPPDYAKVVRMFDLEGRPMSEVAREIGRSEGAAYMLRARAHERLREEMGPGNRFFTHAG